MADEIWCNLEEAQEYFISTWGRVYSVKSKGFLKAYLHKSRANRYLRVNIAGKKYMLHVLVAKYFLPDGRDYIKTHQVNHIDRNTLNCNLNNLEFVTPSQNIKHVYITDAIKEQLEKRYVLLQRERTHTQEGLAGCFLSRETQPV